MNIKNKLVAITNFVPFASIMTFLISVRMVSPKVYNYIESNFADSLVKTDGSFKTIIPKQFLNLSTSNFQVIKSTWENAVLTYNCKANVGSKIINRNLNIIHPHTFKILHLSQLTIDPNKYYILNFGSSS